MQLGSHKASPNSKTGFDLDLSDNTKIYIKLAKIGVNNKGVFEDILRLYAAIANGRVQHQSKRHQKLRVK